MKSLYGIEVQNVMDAILHKRDLAKKTNRNLDSEVQEGTLAVEKKGGGIVKCVGSVAELIAEIVSDIPDSLPNAGVYDMHDDVLARYQSFAGHQDDWGIFFNVEAMQSFICGSSFGDDPSLVMKVLHHERFHFLTETLYASLESPSQGRWGFDFMYKDFVSAKHNSSKIFDIDEAMANAYALTRVYRSPAITPQLPPEKLKEKLCAICDKAPAGYRDYKRVFSRNAYDGKRSVTSNKFLASYWLYYCALKDGRSINIDWHDFDNAELFGVKIHSKQMMLDENILKHIPMYLEYPPPSKNSAPDLMKFMPIPRKITIELSEKFEKSLKKLAAKNQWVQSAWDIAVKKLGDGSYNSQHIEKWKPGGPNMWSVRVGNQSPAYRAHLKERGSGKPWLAEAVGRHDKMGHGK
jgi:mRNA-degrading endonuclease RelE of RelBE toxin-antitoxin system